MRQRLLSPWGILACLMAAYVALFGWLSLARHATFNTHALDLGYTVNTIWNTAHGRPFYFSTYQQAEFELDIPLEEIEHVNSLLSYHVEPLLGPIALLYRLWEDPRLLLMLQTVVIALGALPAYGLAHLQLCHDDTLQSPICAYAVLVFPLIYLLAPSIEAANLSDFHAVALSPTFLLAAFYFLERDRPRWAFLFALLALLCKEEISLLVAMLGFYAVVFRRRWILGMTLAAVGVGWFLLCVQVILPHFNSLPGSAFLVRYEQFGESLGDIASNLLRQPAIFWDWLKRPEVIDYFKVLLGSVGWLALLAPELLALTGPVLAANAFSSYPWMRSVGGHYSASITAFLIIAPIYGTERLGRGLVWSWRRIGGAKQGDNVAQKVWLAAMVATLIVAGLTHHRYGISHFSRRFRVPEVTAHHRLGRQILARVPPNVPVSVQSGLYPHLANRRQAYLFPTVADAEYVVLDVTAETYPATPASQHGRVEELIYSSQFGILAAEDGFLLLKRGLTDAYEFPEDFFSFARIAGHEADVPQHLHADFGALELVGYDWAEQPVITASAPPVVIETYWRTARTPSLAYHVVPYFVGEDGAITWVYGGGTPTALYYPTYTWQPGEIVRVTFPPHETAGLRQVYLGVVRWGGDLLRVDDRLPVLASESNVIKDNTLVWLADLP